MNQPLISRVEASRPRSGDTPVPSPSLRQVCRRFFSTAFLALSLLFPAAQAALFTSFTPGNVVIYRVGNGTGSLVNTGNPVFLDEFSPAGTLVQSVALPTTRPGSNRNLVAAGLVVSEGALSRSGDGRYLTFTGYDPSTLGATPLNTSATGTIFRTIGRVAYDGTVDTSTYLQSQFADGTSPQSAYSDDGSSFWISAKAGPLRHVLFGATSASTQISVPTGDMRQVNAFGEQLYVSQGFPIFIRLATVGTGLPVTSGQAITNLPGIATSNSTSPYGFFFADLSISVAGNDTLYIADDVLGLQKFSLVGGTWTANGSIGTDADDYRGLTATVTGASVTLFATIKGGGDADGGGELVKLTDTSGYNATITGTPTVLATAATNTAFRGVALAPYSRPDLIVDLAAPTTAQAGTPFTYTLTARNIGNVAAPDISLGFVAPAGLTVGTLNGASGFSGFAAGNIVNFTGGSLAGGASATLTINVSSATAGTFTTAAQAAFIDPSNFISEADEANNGSTQIVTTVVSNAPVTSTEYTWDSGTAAGIQIASHNWSTTGNVWTADGGTTRVVWPNTGVEDALFSGTLVSDIFINLNSPDILLDDLTTTPNSNYIYIQQLTAGTRTLTLTGGTYDGTATTGSQFNIASGGGLSLTGTAGTTQVFLTGTSDLVKTGGGGLFFGPGCINNTFTGNIHIYEGTLFVNSANDTSLGNAENDIYINGGTLNSNAASGTYSVGSGRTISLGASGGGIGSSFIPITVQGQITGAGALTKVGSKDLNLEAANTYSGPTTISSGTLSLGNVSALANTSGITIAGNAVLSTSTDAITIGVPITLGLITTTSTVAFSRSTAAVGSFTLNGAISGAGNLIFTTPNVFSHNNLQTINLGAASNYGGNTTITTGNINNTLTVKAGVANALPVTTVLTLNGGVGAGTGRSVTYDLNGNDQTLAGLTNVTGLSLRNQRVTNTGAPATLTVNNSANFTYGGTVVGAITTTSEITGAISLSKSGEGTLTLSGPLSYSGNTTVSGGTLTLSHAPDPLNANPGNDASTVTIAATGAALNLTYTGTDKVDKLFIGTSQQTPGVYGHTNTGATNSGLGVGAVDAYFGIGTGTLTVLSGPPSPTPYSIWAGGVAFNADANNDGVDNGMAWLLGAANPIVNASALLPQSSTFGGNIIFTFQRIQASIDGATTVVIEVGTDQVTWPNVYSIPDTEIAGPPVVVVDNGDGTDTVTLTLPQAPDPIKYIRLKVTTPDGSSYTAPLSFGEGGYASWQAANGTTGGFSEDHDNDGTLNGIEYFLGGTSNTTGLTLLPGVTNTGGTFSVTWTHAPGYLGIYGTDYIVELSATSTGPWVAEILGVTINGNDVTYTFPANGINFVRLFMTGPDPGPDGGVAYTHPVTTGQAPQITTQPASQAIASGSTATLMVVATGNPALTFQWYQGTTGDTSTPVGTNSASFTTPTLTSSTSYWVNVSNAVNPTGVNSTTATVTVTAPPAETNWTGTVDQTTWETAGNWDVGLPAASLRTIIDTSDSVTLSSTATIDSLDLRAGVLTLAAGAGLVSGDEFEVEESFVGGWDSSPATLNLARGSSAFFGYSLLFGGPGTGDSTLNYFGSGATVDWQGSHFFGIHYEAVGRVQWNFHVDRSLPFVPIDASAFLVLENNPAGTSRVRLNIENVGPPLQPGDTFHLVSYGFRVGAFGKVADGSAIIDGQEIVSDGYRFAINYDDLPGTVVSVTVIGSESGTASAITTQPASQTITSGSTATLSVIATGDPAPAFQWYRGNSGDMTTPVGTNSASFTTPALAVNTNYWVKVSNSSGPSVNSNTATVFISLLVNGSFEDPLLSESILVVASPNSTTIPGWTVSQGEVDLLDQTWWAATDGLQTLDVTGDSAGRFYQDIGGLIPGATYRLEFDLSGNPIPPHIDPIKQLRVVAGEADITFDFDVTPYQSSITPVVEMGWVRRSLIFVARSGLERVQFQSLNDDFRGPIIDNVSLVLTDAPRVIIPPAITSQPTASQTISNGSTATLSVTATGLPSPTFQWYRGNSGDTSNPVSGATSASFTTPALTTTTRYWVRATNTSGIPANSSTATVNVTVAPAIITQPVNQTIISGSTATLTVAASGNPAPTLQWYRGNSGDISNLMDGATSATFVTPALTAATSYWAQATNGIGSPANSDTATISLATSDANLANLRTSAGTLSPAFTPLATSYNTKVSNATSSIRITPTRSDSHATLKLNGNTVISGIPSSPIPLNVGDNIITIVVTSADLSNTKTYTLSITRAAPLTLATGAASGLTASSARVNGTVTPFGSGLVYFQYGTTTAYGSVTAGQDVSGDALVNVSANLIGLAGNTTYHYRLVAMNDGGMFYGGNQTFLTAFDPPLAATGTPLAISLTTATLAGAVNPNGLPVEVYFEYGPTTLYGFVTPIQNFAAGTSVVNVQAALTGLTTNATYHYRVVANTVAGTTQGNNISFIANVGEATGGAIPTAVPTVTTGDTVAVANDPTARLLQGSANANGGTTSVYFEYGINGAFNFFTPTQSVGNSTVLAEVSTRADNLLPGTMYHYRLVATNSLGTSRGNPGSFTTDFAKPDASTGDAVALSTTRVQVAGFVRANDYTADVEFHYGTDPNFLTNVIDATPVSISGNAYTSVQADLINLLQGTTYYYQVRADNSGSLGGGQSTANVRSFNVGLLSGLLQQFPALLPASAHQGSVMVDLTPSGIGGGWRFAGEQEWRLSGASASGLANGNRVIDFRPLPGYTSPAQETVVSSGAAVSISRAYLSSGSSDTGTVTVTLKPVGLAGAQWRFFGETDADWKNSGVTSTARPPGNYFIESKPVAARATPGPVTAIVTAEQNTPVTVTYFLADPTVGAGPVLVPFSSVSTLQDKPYAYVGQISSDAGFSSGFIVRKRVVATAGHVAFDDGKLAATTGLQWLFQKEKGVYEPEPLTPRGSYLMTGYAAQRILENTPGTSAPASQDLDAAALYFTEDAGRGGFSGYLASDLPTNEFLVSSASKTLVGYPFEGISPDNQGRMHATPISDVTFTLASGKTYKTTGIYSTGGNSGGPLCILNTDGAWYPAAIYLGGSGQVIVRSIDTDVIRLFGFAEVSGNASAGNTGGDFQISNSAGGTPTQGAIQVNIEPLEARNSGAGWRIEAGTPYLLSGGQSASLSPNNYTVELASIAGFVPPTSPAVSIQAGLLTTVTFTYEKIIFPPVINSPLAITATRGDAILYQISATNSPQIYTLQGILPSGTTFDAPTGRILGTLQESGIFQATLGVSNSGGTDTRVLTISSFPTLVNQQATVAYLQPMSYQILSSESGPGLTFTATNLPDGLALDPSTGLITGTPTSPGTYPILMSVARKGAVKAATLTLGITGSAPIISVNPAASKSIEFGQSTTLAVFATGLPEPTYQWYQGAAGVTTNPVSNATSASFITPKLTANTSYWARASSISGSADSSASFITLTPSSNANLASLARSAGGLTPAFNSSVLSYTTQVATSISSVTLMPVPEISQSTVRINGTLVPSGSASEPLALAVGSNVITIIVTAGNGTTTKTYTYTVTRAAPPASATFATGGATSITDGSAVVNGSVSYFEPTSIFFEYGPAPDFGITTPVRNVSGTNPVALQAALSGLSSNTVYQYRIGVTTASGTQYGDSMTFTTDPARPLAATGDAVAVTTTSARLIGAVNPRGQAVTVFFRYGKTDLYGMTTPDQSIPAGTNVVNVIADISGLTSGAGYHYQLVVKNFTPAIAGEDSTFTAQSTGGSGDGIVDAAPSIQANSETVGLIGTDSANLAGIVNPNDGVTFISFEYGTTPSYGSITPAVSIGNGSGFVATPPALLTGLLPGTLYHYRLIASNSFIPGITVGQQRTFTSGYFPPIVTTGSVAALTSTSATVNGMVNARDDSATVTFEYGTNGVDFPNGIAAFTPTVTGDQDTQVSALIENLDPLLVYSYRVKASSSGGQALGQAFTFQVGALQGLTQNFTLQVPVNDRQGQVQVNLQPAGVGGWRFVGETQWRAPGALAVNLTTGQRDIEYQPAFGYVRPLRESVGVISGEAALVINSIYVPAVAASTGILKFILLPEAITAQSVPVGSRAQWRVVGDPDLTWRNSGDEVTGLGSGSYLVECKTIPGSDTPAVSEVVVTDGTTSTAGVTYFPVSAPSLNPPAVIAFVEASSSQNLPYAYVGQIRTNFGSHSGFVVKPRVVATVGQAIFNEGTLTVATGMQWLLQQDRGNYEPAAQTPRGFYVFDGYASQRDSEGSPGTLAMASQNLNVAALYFASDAGRGGFSGFLASDALNNEFLQSSSLKTLVGYPLAGIPTSNRGRMHATPPLSSSFTFALGRTYTSAGIRGAGGMTGGPLCVQYQDGRYFPAGIYVGGTSLSSVRAIDRDVIDLFTRAELSGSGGDNNTGGGITHSSFTSLSSSGSVGSIQVTIEPAAARTAGAFWKLGSDPEPRLSGATLAGKTSGSWNVVFKTDVAGFQSPPSQTVTIRAGQLTHIEFTYLANVPPPVITSASAVTHERGKTLNHQIVAANTPSLYSLTGVLPSGLTLKTDTGLIAGAPTQAGVFELGLTASNDGGTATQTFRLTVVSSALELWRFERFNTYANSGNAADSADPDGDGSRNIDEYVAGTDPNSGADQFKVLTVTKNATQFILTANGRAARTYVLERSAALIPGSWTIVSSEGPLSTDGLVTLTDFSPLVSSGFYRIRVSLP